jgi:hypothetical protein
MEEAGMRKLVLAAAALAGVTALTGASAAPAAAPGVDSREAHTLRWRLTEVASHDVGRTAFVGTDRIRSVRTGEVVGYSSYRGRFFPADNSARLDVAASVKGGILVGRLRGTFDTDGEVFRGPVLKGTGKFQGAEGTIVGRPVGETGRILITVRYTT